MQLAIFDLDGTLLDTLDDLTDAVNAALARASFPPRTRDEVRRFVGDGVAQLIRRALPAGTDEGTVTACLADFKATYAAGCAVKTAPYPGVLALLDALREHGIHVAVVSNKFDAGTRALCRRYFGDRVEMAVGERLSEGIRRKPAPDGVFEVMAAFGLSPDRLDGHRVTYIGDSDVDIATAQNAGIPCISVTWGFRDAAFLRERGATTTADCADAVLSYLTK